MIIFRYSNLHVENYKYGTCRELYINLHLLAVPLYYSIHNASFYINESSYKFNEYVMLTEMSTVGYKVIWPHSRNIIS